MVTLLVFVPMVPAFFFKDLMRRHDVLPLELVYRPKSWMTSPTARWFRDDLHATLTAVLLGSIARARGLFDPLRVARLLDEHRSARADHSYLLGMLLAVEVWHRLFVDPPVLAKPDWTLAQCVEG